MESLSTLLSTSSPKPLKTHKPTSHCPPKSPHSHKFHIPPQKISPFTLSTLTFTIPNYITPNPSFALDPLQTSSSKIDVEAIVNSIDDFFNKNPFFVSGCFFIWLIVIPLAKEYLSKCKFVSAIDGFRKLRDDPNAQLLDIRDVKSLKVMGSPSLNMFGKSVVQVDFDENEDVDEFVKRVLDKFEKPENTVVCVLDSVDGNSLKVAELLFKNGFKEAYAIKGGLRGENGWMAIQETLLPPSVHVYRRKKKKKKIKVSEQLGTNGAIDQQIEKSDQSSTTKTGFKSSSPYPNYPDLKPPSSPMPSKP
ncbi:hypothetical protein ACFE04_029547 [Oxalis oulophora]